ncbi:LOW QUALITY PROTEIN: uncharacterized protein LOC6566605 [Drosophila grimshawi]|uniref:LOW QUALITY PROTEIN: uncharacterized protein LOC6566605 n=1 Tax=Drosophila grimshawi TaxID=7222 RepID=UPI000C86EB60|nr:LOW QUALITY PROTEIN: uncharacterized protein LOC6566605 [Drosophila grimshawi]
MRSMFRPIKKIFTYIQKNASAGAMFGTTTSSIIKPEDESATSNQLEQAEKLELAQQLPLEQVQETKAEQQQQQLDDEDIERQIKTSIIDASKVHAAKAKLVQPLQLQLDDELADFVDEPLALASVGVDVEEEDDDDDDVVDEDLEEQFLELDNFPNNEIIVLSDQDLNSSLASDNISEDPLAIDDYAQKEVDDDEEEDEEEADSSGDLLWLKLDTPSAQLTIGSSSSCNSVLPVAGCIISSSSSAAAVTAGTVIKPPTRRREEELRSDAGSDSGLGGENDRQTTTTTATTTTSLQKPLRSNLKRRLDDDAMELELLPISSCSSITQKRPKRSINFDNVKIYYFPRQQGFGCVPTAGGCTLGMGARHIAFKTMTLAEHASELRRAHRSQNQEQQQQQAQQQLQQTRGSSSDDSEESEEDYLSEGSGSDADDGSNGFLQPVTPKQRRVLLKAAGVRKIDASEKIDCRDIRNSREVCGCSCREFCDPETCACSQAGIKCQVDRAMFPCGCSREACGNTVGRVEFNPTRVRTHYIHTVMRLDMEQRQSGTLLGGEQWQWQRQQQRRQHSAVAAAAAAAAASSHCFFMQPQSNYSSGYASPAYTPETSVSYYQQQQQTPQTSPGSTVNGNATQPQSSYATIYPQLDSLDSGLFTTGSNATPSYGELLTPTFHQTISYGSNQLNSYNGYQQTTPNTGGGIAATVGGYSSCAVPSVPPFGNATTTASNATQYQNANALGTTAATMISISNSSSISITASSCASGLARIGGGGGGGVVGAGPVDFISLNAPISSSSRLSQINDLLQHNRNTTVALVAVSEGYAAVRSSSSSNSCSASSTSGTTTTINTSTTIDSIDTPPIVEEAQRSCMTFEGLPPPLINPTPIVAVLDQQPQHKQLMGVATTPQPRQPLDASASLAESLPSSSN